MKINGKTYIVLSKTKVAGFTKRFEIALKLPKGKRTYHAVEYENGEISCVV